MRTATVFHSLLFFVFCYFFGLWHVAYLACKWNLCRRRSTILTVKFDSGNKTLIKLFSQTLFHGSIAKYSLWEILKKRKQITKLLIGRWFFQIPNEMTSWHSLTIYTPSFHLFFVVVFCPPHLTAGGPKPTTNFTHINKKQLKMKKFLRHIFTINKLISEFVFFFA